MTVSENISMSVLRKLSKRGLIQRSRAFELVDRFVKRLGVRCPSPNVPSATLSGGNQQKVVLSKWLATDPDVLILDEPTRGVDVGAKAAVHQLILDLAASGMATLVISSDTPELLLL